MLNSTTIKLHQYVNGKKCHYHEETWRSRRGLTTKVHSVTDGLGNPLRFLLSRGNRNGICMAQALLEPFDLNGKDHTCGQRLWQRRFCKIYRTKGKRRCHSQSDQCKDTQGYRQVYLQRATSGREPLSQIEEQSPFCHQIWEERPLFPRCYFPYLQPCLGILTVLKHPLGRKFYKIVINSFDVSLSYQHMDNWTVLTRN